MFLLFGVVLKWASAWQNLQNGMCAQRRHKLAWASTQSNQSLCCALSGQLRTQAFFMRSAKTLIRLSGCWARNPFCRVCHALAQISANLKGFWFVIVAFLWYLQVLFCLTDSRYCSYVTIFKIGMWLLIQNDRRKAALLNNWNGKHAKLMLQFSLTFSPKIFVC